MDEQSNGAQIEDLAETEIQVSPPPKLKIRKEPRKAPQGPKIITWILVIAVLAIALLSFFWFTQSPEPVPIADEEPDSAVVQDLWDQAQGAIAQRNWDDALAILEKIPAGALLDGLDLGEAKTQVTVEKTSLGLLQSAIASFEETDSIDQGVAALRRISPNSVYYDDAQELRNKVISDEITTKTLEIRGMISDGKKDESLAAFLALSSKYPHHELVKSLRKDLATAFGADSLGPTLSPGSSENPRGSLSHVHGHYNAGEFPKAIAIALETANKWPGEPGAKAKRAAQFIEEFSISYKGGKNEFANKNYPEALVELSNAIRLDARINGRYHSELRGLIVQCHQAIGTAAQNDGNCKIVRREAESLLKLVPSDPWATQALDDCKDK